MSRLLLVRHGATDTPDRGVYWGQTDIALSRVGIIQAEQLRDRLAEEKIGEIYASDLRRARQTAEIIAEKHPVSVITRRRLREIDFGDFEGLTYREIGRRWPEAERYWSADDPEVCFPNGESVGQVNRRIGEFLAEVARPDREGAILVVAHGGPLRLLICRVLGIDFQHWPWLRLDLASLSVVETRSETGALRLLNDVSHLE